MSWCDGLISAECDNSQKTEELRIHSPAFIVRQKKENGLFDQISSCYIPPAGWILQHICYKKAAQLQVEFLIMLTNDDDFSAAVGAKNYYIIIQNYWATWSASVCFWSPKIISNALSCFMLKLHNVLLWDETSGDNWSCVEVLLWLCTFWLYAVQEEQDDGFEWWSLRAHQIRPVRIWEEQAEFFFLKCPCMVMSSCVHEVLWILNLNIFGGPPLCTSIKFSE